MSWRFLEPRLTVAVVAERLATGLRDGSVVLDEPLADEPLANDGIVVQLDVPDACTDGEVLDVIKVLTLAADESHRHKGGHGLSLIHVHWVSMDPPRRSGKRVVRVNLGPRNESDQPELMQDVLTILRQRADLPLGADN